MLKLAEVSDYNELDNYKDLWNDLLSKSKIDNIFLTYEWVQACIRYFHMNERLLMLNVFDDEVLVGIAPLMIRRCKYFGLPVRLLCFIGTTISDRMDFIIDKKSHKKEIITLMMDYIIKIKAEWDFIDLQEIADHTNSAQIIEEWLGSNKMASIIGPQTRSFLININKNNKEVLLNTFTKKLRNRLKKIDFQKLRFQRYIDADMKDDRLFSEIAFIENNSWKGYEKKGLFSRESGFKFHREIFNKFSRRKWIDLSILYFGNTPIAFVYNYLYGHRLYNYSIAFDKKYEALSPGNILMLWTLKDSVVKDISEVDFVRGEAFWKQRLTDNFRIHNRIRIFKDTFYSKNLYYFQKNLIPRFRRNKMLRNTWLKSKEIFKWN